MPEPKRILIAGAGIAGPALALLLLRSTLDCQITIVERAPALRDGGQQIDVTGEGLKVVRHMGIEENIRARTVKDDGIKFVDSNDNVLASFPVGKAELDGGERFSLVREIEIMRTDLVSVLYERTKDEVEYIFGDYISEIQQPSDLAEPAAVTFAKSGKEEKYDIIVAADGLRSRTRALAFPESNTRIMSLSQWVCFFDVPWQESDGTWSRAYNSPNSRNMGLRPNKAKNTTGAYFGQMSADSGAVATMPAEQQRQEVLKRFRGAGWETERVLKELETAPEGRFYVQETAQAKSASLAHGRVALLGDAGYCPSPVSGQGTSLAFVGAFILAGCIVTNPNDIRGALARYEQEVRPFVNNSQKLPPGVPWIVLPQTMTGVMVLRNVLWAASLAVNSGVAGVLSKAYGWLPALPFESKALVLPEFPVLKPAKE